MITTPEDYAKLKRQQLAQEVRTQLKSKGCSIITLAAFAGVHPNVIHAILREQNTTINSLSRVCFMLEIEIIFF